MRLRVVIIGCGLALGLSVAGEAHEPEARCEADKLRTAGKYARCLLKAESKTVRRDRPARTTQCDRSFDSRWEAIELQAQRKGADGCPAFGNAEAVKARISEEVSNVAVVISGGSLPACGDGLLDPNAEDCDGPELGGQSCESLGFGSGTLACSANCGLDSSGCTPFSGGSFPATGQITCWDSILFVVPCAGTGQDGDAQAGAALSYLDNGDGTITDLNTGLMWEKKSDDGTIHDKDNIYNWEDAFAVHAVGLNDPNAPFAGHADWRVPNRKELDSLVDLNRVFPSIDPAFDTGCTAGCTVTTCSCTASLVHWSSTTSVSFKALAWIVTFRTGDVASGIKDLGNRVRAVRGGP